MDKDFVMWLNREMERRGWSNSELARRAGVAPSTLSKAISGYNRPGFDLCAGIAQAFGYPPEQVLRRAGLLPALPGPEEDVSLAELQEVARQLSTEERRRLAGLARHILSEQRQHNRDKSADNNDDPSERPTT